MVVLLPDDAVAHCVRFIPTSSIAEVPWIHADRGPAAGVIFEIGGESPDRLRWLDGIRGYAMRRRERPVSIVQPARPAAEFVGLFSEESGGGAAISLCRVCPQWDRSLSGIGAESTRSCPIKCRHRTPGVSSCRPAKAVEPPCRFRYATRLLIEVFGFDPKMGHLRHPVAVVGGLIRHTRGTAAVEALQRGPLIRQAGHQRCRLGNPRWPNLPVGRLGLDENDVDRPSTDCGPGDQTV